MGRVLETWLGSSVGLPASDAVEYAAKLRESGYEDTSFLERLDGATVDTLACDIGMKDGHTFTGYV